ncbi:MAG: MBL fold metallo-hydrolase [Prevotellaceae bacterium]|nr:MBL fold metallo-hydrolase [Prevotellaceae bacterium]
MKYTLSLLLMLLFVATGKLAAQEPSSPQDVITFEVGAMRISALSEGQQSGGTSVLLGATPAMLQKYAPDGSYPSAVNAFMVRSATQNVLIDAGFGRKLFDNLQALGLAAEQVNAVLLTHMHGDHIGGLLRGDTAAFPNATLYIAQAEHDYWTSDKAMQAAPENRRGSFRQACKVVAAYKGRLRLFTPDKLGEAPSADLLPAGIQPIAAYGHTPGHTAYLLQSEGSRLLVWGDLTHAMPIQVPHPEVSVTYDVDPQQAAATRRQVLEYVAKNKIPVGGMHIAFPAIGNLKVGTEEAYTFDPFCDCLAVNN